MSLKDAFRRVEPGQAAPEAPQALRTWTQQTTHGLLGGMLFGGYRGLRLSRNTAIQSPVPSSHPAHRAAAFFVRESILTGARVGLFVSLFSAATLTLREKRGVDDVTNYVTAGAVTCGLFGGGVGGWMGFLPAGMFGGVAAGAAKMLQDRLGEIVKDMEHFDEEQVCEHVDAEVKGSVARVVDKYEASLAAHPLRVQRALEEQASSAKP